MPHPFPVASFLFGLSLLSAQGIAFPADRPAPQKHPVAVNATAGSREPRDRDLADAARAASDALIKRQSAAGYWLTAWTEEARFDRVGYEMNTFTPAVIVDIVDPVAERAGLTSVVARARSFLGEQIEADGLVRYHGRPDAATIGRLGCVITPDSDDTALVWRTAPGADAHLRSQALAKLAEFRAPNGLYRTWLAPQDRYQCIDPGKDPNPTDIGIQMHVLMLLAQVDLPGAASLCAALSKESANDDIWVYYAMAPLVPVLRLADMRRAQCPLQLPESRSRATVPGQSRWIQLVQLLEHMEAGLSGPQDDSRASALLHEIAANGFSLAKSAPPLMYHNDFSAHFRRFYWSEDMGYAIWLRVYIAREQARAAKPRA